MVRPEVEMGGLRLKGKRLEGHVTAKVTNLIPPDLVGSYVTSAGTACSLCSRYLGTCLLGQAGPKYPAGSDRYPYQLGLRWVIDGTSGSPREAGPRLP